MTTGPAPTAKPDEHALWANFGDGTPHRWPRHAAAAAFLAGALGLERVEPTP